MIFHLASPLGAVVLPVSVPWLTKLSDPSSLGPLVTWLPVGLIQREALAGERDSVEGEKVRASSHFPAAPAQGFDQRPSPSSTVAFLP